jgi:hypothetical protein
LSKDEALSVVGGNLEAEEAYRLFDTQTTGKGVFLM